MKNHSEKLDCFSHMLDWHSAAMARIISILSKMRQETAHQKVHSSANAVYAQFAI